ncbi:hypothetical protein HOO65_030200 [Ceratocystis lukuohia]|uniref:Uncharacterized protein n=3 Tax=Ceratocystis TaxID=5157 RepID=A0A0F8DDY1_CERFI|nr:hypothetical protein CFO_g3457 [Ceratocystis platani]PHH53156.1 hypothetical protein CFIMG_008282RA00001 [Ceratocystis fimbriata CBS 114723]
MASAALWQIIADKRVRRQAWETAVRLSDSPLVKCIQAGDTVGTVRETIREINRFVPSMQVVGKSMCDSAHLFGYFNAAAMAAQVGSNMVLTYQGMQALQLIAEKLEGISTTLAAQTALMAQKDFPQYVHAMLRERIGQTSADPHTSHWFFVFHPDNDWYPPFYQLLEKEPLGPSFCGYTNQIDTCFLFMLAARRLAEKRDRHARRRRHTPVPVRIHLLIPAYQPILVAEPLRIPDEIGDFVMEGRIHNNKNFVWFNLPDEQRHYCDGIGMWQPPSPGFFMWAFGRLGLVNTGPELGERRVIGTSQDGVKKARVDEKEIGDEEPEEDISSVAATAGDLIETGSSTSSNGRGNNRKRIEEAKKTAMPLHQRQSQKEPSRRSSRRTGRS